MSWDYVVHHPVLAVICGASLGFILCVLILSVHFASMGIRVSLRRPASIEAPHPAVECRSLRWRTLPGLILVPIIAELALHSSALTLGTLLPTLPCIIIGLNDLRHASRDLRSMAHTAAA